jgi:SAM-dependent methyltransferase
MIPDKEKVKVVKSHQEIWEEHTRDITIGDLLKAYHNPPVFQRELAAFLIRNMPDLATPASLEVGSSFGITSALLPQHFKRNLLDQSALILEKARALYQAIGLEVTTYTRDIFDVDRLDKLFELVFSAGLVEHFSTEDRTRIVETMARLTKVGGVLVIAVPNHASLPYRSGYIARNLLGSWSYPPEERVLSLEREMRGLPSVVHLETTTLDSITSLAYAPRKLRRLFRMLDRVRPFEGYLKVFAYRKED